jgi:calcineurin-like phosphoesterase family protein
MIYVTSDHHFNHFNVIGYSQRSFSDVNAMNEFMISCWNTIIKEEDIVIHIGDFAFGDKKAVKSISDRLYGKKFLVVGNHDRHSSNFYLHDCGFIKTFRRPKYVKEADIVFAHNPHKIKLPKSTTKMIHGHVHKNLPFINNYGWNVSVDVINYIPIRLDMLINIKKYNAIDDFFQKIIEEKS